MGPHSCECGILGSDQPAIVPARLLQWGRTPVSAESQPLATSRRACRSRLQWGRTPVSAESYSAGFIVPSHCALQWGRTPVSAESQDITLVIHLIVSFNGAALL